MGVVPMKIINFYIGKRGRYALIQIKIQDISLYTESGFTLIHS